MASTSSPSSGRSTVGSSTTVTTVGSNALHSSRVPRFGLGRQMDDRGSARDRQLHDLGGAAPAARRKPVPDRDQYVAMRDGRAAGHHISVELVVSVAGKLEDAGRALEQLVEALPRRRRWRGRAIFARAEGKHRLKLPAELERDLGGDLVGAVGDRRYEPQLLRVAGKQALSM